MKFEATKIATAVAVGLGVSVVTVNIARADAIMFPYFGVSDTVTSIVTVINTAEHSDGTDQLLHYRFFYKEGANAESLSAPCAEGDLRRPTSPRDVVTFDLSGHFGDENGVLAEPAAKQIKANYGDQSFAFMKPAQKPARGFMIVDNNLEGNSWNFLEESIFGEIMLIDFVEGAVWGYSAYNAAAPLTTIDGVYSNTWYADFSDRNETQGEVLAGSSFYTPAGARANLISNSPPVPVGILPMQSVQPAGTAGAITKFFVTPINHAVTIRNLNAVGATQPLVTANSISDADGGQLTTRLAARVKLSVYPYTGGPSDVAFNRDEQAVSSSGVVDVTCVGAVPVESFFSSITTQDIGIYGGWSAMRVTAPGPLLANVVSASQPTPPVDPNTLAVVSATRTLNVNQAVVFKLEYNPSGDFLADSFKGAFNNGLWLRRGIRESFNPLFPLGIPNDPLGPNVTVRPLQSDGIYYRTNVASFYDETTEAPVDQGAYDFYYSDGSAE